MAQATVVESLIKQGENLNRQFVGTTDTVATRRIAVENLQFRPQTVVVTTTGIDSAYFYLSTPTYILSQSLLDSTNILGDGTVHETGDTIQKVVNLNNTYYDYLYHDALWSSTSTATLTTSSYRVDLDTGEVALIGPVYKDSSTVTSATLQLEIEAGNTNFVEVDTITTATTFPLTFPVTFTSGTGIKFEMSANGGSNWEDVDNNTKHTFTNTGTELWFRMTAGEDGLYYKTENTNGKHIPIKILYEVTN